MTLTWLTIRIGYDDADRLISYPYAQHVRKPLHEAAVPMSDDGDTYQKFRMQFDCMNFQQSQETLQFQRRQFKY